jgi:hypothetical protein
VNRGQKIKGFIDRWREEFRKASPRRQRREFSGKREHKSHWESERAYNELERKGLLLAVLLKANLQGLPRIWQRLAAIREIATEVQIYSDNAGKIVQQSNEIRETNKFLKRMAGHFLKARNGLQDSTIRGLLTRYRLQFEADRDRLLKRQDKIWDNPPGAMGKILISHTNKKRIPVKEDDLDTLFQIRVAQIFRTFLHKEDISRETISRLVVLVYIVGELAEEQMDYLVIRHSNRKLKITDVTQRLSRAGIK